MATRQAKAVPKPTKTAAWIVAQSEAIGATSARCQANTGTPANAIGEGVHGLMCKREAEAYVKAGEAATAWLVCQETSRTSIK